MNNSQRLSTFNYSLSPLQVLKVNTQGNSYNCLKANIPFQIKIDDDQFSDCRQGLGFKNDNSFNNLTVKNISNTSDLVIELAVAFGELIDRNFSISGGDAINQKKGNNFINGAVSIDGLSSVPDKILDENKDRLSVILFNNDINGTVYIGGQGVTVANGLPILPNGVLVLENGAEIYGITTGQVVEIRYLYELV